MIEKFLKAKHWQLFLFTFGIPILFQIIMTGNMFRHIDSGATADPLFLLDYIKFFPFMMIIFMGVFFGWLWSVAIGLQQRVPYDIQMKVNRFKFFFFIPVIYLVVIIPLFMFQMDNIISSKTEPSNELIASILGIIVPLHLFSMFCIFYMLYFVAKTFKTVELQREVKFSEFTGEFFTIWFYPIGIWIIQPIINKMAEE